jgi:demethylmacrocin O-methyltransferase
MQQFTIHPMIHRAGLGGMDQYAGGTDKTISGQGYVAHYDAYFNHLRSQKVRLLELGIGCSHECPSLRMWEKYFPNGDIFGVDITPAVASYQGRAKTIVGNLEDPLVVANIKAAVGICDIIIDDASHHVIQQQKLFKEFWPMVKNNGLYVIEDLCGSYMKAFGGGYKQKDTTMEMLKSLIDCVNHAFYKVTSFWPHMAQYGEAPVSDSVTAYDKEIASMHFYRNIAFIFKGVPSE